MYVAVAVGCRNNGVDADTGVVDRDGRRELEDVLSRQKR